MMRFLAFCLIAGIAGTSSATLVFSENFGTPSGTTTFASFTGSANSSSGLTFTGTGDVRTTTASTGYTGATGGGNALLSVATRTMFISGIDTSAYDPSTFALSFGVRKGTTASNLTGLLIAYSTDGVNFTNLQNGIPAQPTGAGTANWRLITLTPADIPASSSLSLRFTNSDGVEYRLDDITFSGDLAAIPEPTAALFGSLLAGAFGLMVARRPAVRE